MNVHIVSHTHWDREWYLTFEQFRLRLVGLVDRLLDLMESRPDFEFFHLDGQTIVLEDYLELRPEQEPRLRKLIGEGRILIGPWYDMPDEFLVSGESLVRNLALGHRVAARFGTAMPVGYLPDLFGHVGQMPQILRHFGLDNAILWRGFGGPRAEYWWEAPDGSRVLMMHLPPEGYCNATRVHLDPARMIERASGAIEKEAARTRVDEVLMMNGVDHVEPHPIIPELARRLTDTTGRSVRHSTLPAYVDAVRSAVNNNGVAATLETIYGELRSGEDYANLLPGVFSARVYIKQANVRVQTLLEKRAEPLATFAWMLGAAYPAGELAYAWKTLLQNHPHDSICGCSIDPVHEENMTRFARAEQVARGVVDQSTEVLARAVPAGEPGALRLVAINTTAQRFSGVIEATIDIPFASAEPWRHVDAGALDAAVAFWPEESRVASVTSHAGGAVPFQILGEQTITTFVMMRYDTPWGVLARRVRLAWVGEVPPCGYTTFDVRLDTPAGGAAETSGHPSRADNQRTAENTYARITINDDGTVDVLDKGSGVRYERCGELEDVGDVGDEYNYSPPAADLRITSANATNVCITRILDGPVRSAFQIDLTLPLPAAASEDRSSRSAEMLSTHVRTVVSLDHDSPRLTWQGTVDNRSNDHRLRMLFPTGAESIPHVRAETAFGVAVRAARRLVPKENRCEVPVSYGPTAGFTDAGDDRAGAILCGEGLAEYEALPDAHGRITRLGLTLLRSVGYLSRADLTLRPSGHAGPGLATPGAQCPGPRTFRLAFEPRATPPPNSGLFDRTASFSTPVLVVPALGAGGTHPPAGTFLSIDADGAGVVLSACHRATNTAAVLVRLFNPDESAAAVSIRTAEPVDAAHRVDFLENPLDSVAVAGGAAKMTVGPHRIETILLPRTRPGWTPELLC